MIKQKLNKKLNKKLWGFDERINGVRVRRFEFTTKNEAEIVLQTLKQEARLNKYGVPLPQQAPLLSEVIAARLKAIETKRETIRASRVFRLLAKIFPAGMRLDQLDTPALRKYIDKRLEEVSPVTVDRELNIISAMLHAAPDYFTSLKKYICPKIPRPKYPRRRRERVLTNEERRKLLDWLMFPQREGENESDAKYRQRVGTILRFGLLTGMRHGEINKLRWSEVDVERCELKVIGTKTDAVRYIPLTDVMKSIILSQPRVTPFIFTYGGNTDKRFYRILRAAAAACGIAYGKGVADGFIFHDTRHRAVSRMLQGGVDLATIGTISGHRDKTLVLYYSHANPATRNRAVAILSDEDND